jgi:O-methyltransferase
VSREISGDQLRLRAAGMDWPAHGLTMVGLDRLDDLQACVESVVRDGVEGDLIEAGAWRGGASILMRATLDSLGADRTVWVADSFQGFPAPQDTSRGGDELSAFDFLAVAVEEVRENFNRLGLDRGVELLPGFFDQTLPGLAGRRWAVIRVDADTYEATRLALECLYPGLSTGGHLVVDDYGALEECRRAVDEFRREHGVAEPLEEVDWTGVRWRRETEPAPAARVPGADASMGAALTSADSERERTRAGVPTIRELALQTEVAQLQERLAAAEAEAARLGRSSAMGLRSRLRRRLRRGPGRGA